MSDVAVKEHPILFSAPMIRAILAGRKTQTRRLVARPSFKQAGKKIVVGCDACWHAAVPHNGEEAENGFGGPCYLRVPACDHVGTNGYPGGGRIWPKWNIGDRLMVKEGLRRADWDGMPTGAVLYAADDTPAWDVSRPCAWGWKNKALPSMYCPRGLSRINLEVAHVRVERLLDISEADARAEGVVGEQWTGSFHDGSRSYDGPEHRHRHGFFVLWEQINGVKATWTSNPLVWVILFRRIQP